ncbi:MAG: TrkA family potassium uptake protein [Clostridia bacterium]|nr:TrkA family potassium uptake protein [Clostridia bacterium]
MRSKKTYAVFGLGRYGSSVAEELSQSGADVIAVDADEDAVNEAALKIPVCKCADVTDRDALMQLGIEEVDVVIIAMAQSLEASVIAIMLCKEAGVKTVVAKCASEMHGRIYKNVGADRVVLPEKESGVRLAKNLLSSGFVDLIEISDDLGVVELEVKPEWAGKNLIELNLRKKYSINVVAIKEGKTVTVTVDPEKKLTEDMTLIVIATMSGLQKLD